MKGYKAFKKGMICDPTGHNPYQYAENTVFEQEEETDICHSGYSAQITSTGKDSVICCAGNNSIAKAKIGSWITLSEWKFDKTKGHYVPVCVKTEYVDGKKIKADTFYKLENGEFVEYK